MADSYMGTRTTNLSSLSPGLYVVLALSVQKCFNETNAQNFGHWPASCRTLAKHMGVPITRLTYPPFPPSLPACCQVLRYGFETARGIAGGLVGEKDDWAKTADASRGRYMRDNILSYS
jgi:hypothetical protein